MRADGSKGGLGLKLIRSFAAQLQGVLTFVSPLDGTGTTLTLTIPGAAKQA
jgi:signal transduction histidine kinase